MAASHGDGMLWAYVACLAARLADQATVGSVSVAGMRTGTSRRARNAQPRGPLVMKVTPQKARSSPRASRAVHAAPGPTLGPGRSPGRSSTTSPRWRRKKAVDEEDSGEAGGLDIDSDSTLSIVNGIRGIACDDDAGLDERSADRGASG